MSALGDRIREYRSTIEQGYHRALSDSLDLLRNLANEADLLEAERDLVTGAARILAGALDRTLALPAEAAEEAADGSPVGEVGDYTGLHLDDLQRCIHGLRFAVCDPCRRQRDALRGPEKGADEARPCPKCSGYGTVLVPVSPGGASTLPCGSCHGSGNAQVTACPDRLGAHQCTRTDKHTEHEGDGLTWTRNGRNER